MRKFAIRLFCYLLIWFNYVIVKALAELASCPFESSAPTSQCPEGWMFIPVMPRSCVRPYTDGTRLSWKGARDVCRKEGGDLVTINTIHTNHLFIDLMWRGSTKLFWIGLNTRNAENEWMWQDIDGPTPVSEKGVLFLKKYLKDKKTTEQQCSILEMDRRNAMVLIQEKCDATRAFICDAVNQNNGKCFAGWTNLITGPTYKCVKIFYKPLNWTEAVEHCKSLNATLFTRLNKFLIKKIFILMIELQSWWFGLRKDSKDWSWLSGYPLSKSRFTRWRTRRPNSSELGHRRCALMDAAPNWIRSQTKYFWSVSNCSQPRNFMCQMAAFDRSSDVRMEIQYHRPDGVLYLGHPVNATCSGVGYGDLTANWTLHTGKHELAFPSGGIIKEEEILSNNGTCNKTLATFALDEQDFNIGASEISCFVGQPSVKFQTKCKDVLSGVLKSCDRKPFVILDGPKRSPSLNISYPGAPGPVYRGELVTAECGVDTGPDGTLMWVVYFGNKTFVLDKNNSMVSSYKDFSNLTYAPFITSTLEFPMGPSTAGLSFACFAYDASKYADRLLCNASDMFCIQSLVLKMKENEQEEFSFFDYLPHFGIGIAVFIFIVLVATLERVLANLDDDDAESIRELGNILDDLEGFIDEKPKRSKKKKVKKGKMSVPVIKIDNDLPSIRVESVTV